jgi:NAD(P)H-dependent FMN reductase
MLKIAIIVGTTRPGRKAASVAEWAYDIARERTDAAFTILDLATFELPNLDEPLPAPSGSYEHAHTRTALQEQALTTMLDHVVAWSRAMRGLREAKNHA